MRCKSKYVIICSYLLFFILTLTEYPLKTFSTVEEVEATVSLSTEVNNNTDIYQAEVNLKEIKITGKGFDEVCFTYQNIIYAYLRSNNAITD